jgi:hypothetical protein
MIQSKPVSILRFINQFNMRSENCPHSSQSVETLFGREQAIFSAEDWLDGIEQVLGPNHHAAATGARSQLFRLRGWRTDWLLRIGRQAMLITTHSAAQSSLKSQQIRHARGETQPSGTRQISTQVRIVGAVSATTLPGFSPQTGNPEGPRFSFALAP